MIVETATTRPEKLGRPFAQWSIRELTDYLGKKKGRKIRIDSSEAMTVRRAKVGMRCYHHVMAVRKLSVALDESVAAQAADAAERRGVSLSAWLNAAAERALLIEDGLAGVAEWEAQHGELSVEELAWADSVLDRSVAAPVAS